MRRPMGSRPREHGLNQVLADSASRRSLSGAVVEVPSQGI